MSQYKLIAVDIDGTLLNSKSQLTERTVKAVKSLVDKGVYFVLSTGRPYQGITKFIDALGLKNMPYILYNGAMVMVGGEVVYSLTIPEKTAAMVADEGHKRNSTQICWADNQLYAEADTEKVRFYKSISGVEPVILPDLSALAEKGITKFVWYDDKESTAKYFTELTALMGDKINVHPSRVDFLEFVNKNCSKAVAMQILMDKFGLEKCETVAVGDGFNDLPMLEYAGLGVAMGNADQKVKDKCGYVTSSCDEDGLAEFIEKNLL